MKIYVAHNYAARHWLRTIIKELANDGHEITSRWITDDTHDVANDSNALADLEDVDRADGLLLFVDQFSDRPGRGKHVELGYALGKGKQCFLFGADYSCIFYELPQVIRLARLADLPV